MARILAIDYGARRCGLAATDNEQIIATPLGFQPTENLVYFLKDYFKKEEVEKVILGIPESPPENESHSTPLIREFQGRFKREFPDKEIILHDESFTSRRAVEAMVQGGMKKKNRRKKGSVDAIAATLILQSYLESK